MTALLSLQHVSVDYGPVRAVRDIALHVEPGEVVAVLGANGAGKSSIVKAVVGLARGASGSILFKGEAIDKLPSDRRAARGLAYVPEGRRVFADLTVRENLLMGAYLVPRLAAPRMMDVFALFPRLAERHSQIAATLSGGEQQMLAIGRALMRGPDLLVLDEPSLGLSPIMMQLIYRTLGDVRARGIAILLAEQSAHLALRLADRAYLLETGRVVLEGPAGALHDDPRMREAYLGVG